MLAAAGTILLLLLLVLLLLLALPLGVDFHVAWDESWQDDVRLRWAFGLVRTRLRLTGARKPAPAGESADQAAAPSDSGGGRRGGGGRGLLRAFRDEAFRRRLVRFLRDVRRAVDTEELRLRARIGLGDPADTGRLWALLGPLQGNLAALSQSRIEIDPDFVDATLVLDASGRVRVVPLRLLALGAGLFLSPPVWRGLRQLRAAS